MAFLRSTDAAEEAEAKERLLLWLFACVLVGCLAFSVLIFVLVTAASYANQGWLVRLLQ